jgi:hypothetical protein
MAGFSRGIPRSIPWQSSQVLLSVRRFSRNSRLRKKFICKFAVLKLPYSDTNVEIGANSPLLRKQSMVSAHCWIRSWRSGRDVLG